MFDIGPEKLAIIFGAVLLFLGPKELPALARKIDELRRQLRSFQETLRSEVNRMTDLTTNLHRPDQDAPQDDSPETGQSFT